ncbi:MAG: HAD-IC family P-type ATPase [Pseudomonadota bacterium]
MNISSSSTSQLEWSCIAPFVHSLAALAFIGWMIAGAGWHQSLVIAIAVLIITCPCAMGLAVPTAQVVASGALLKRGLLVKDGSALERLAEADIALFDKTGTLTLGQPRPEIAHLTAQQRSIALALAQTSRHPLSRGLTATLTSQSVSPAGVTDIREVSGQGILGEWNGQPVAIERADSPGGSLAADLRVGNHTTRIELSDHLRPDANDALKHLDQLGLAASILSGDHSASVDEVGHVLGVQAKAGVSPQGKLDALEALKRQGHKPLMVGDGLNDGPALAAAHASIAPGTASDASQQAADAVFIGEKLMPVALAVRVARSTMRVVRQNFVFAIGYNVLAIPLALFGYVTPLIAAIAMSVSSLVVVANSLRLAGEAR